MIKYHYNFELLKILFFSQPSSTFPNFVAVIYSLFLPTFAFVGHFFAFANRVRLGVVA